MNRISKYRIKACVICLVPLLSILLGACADEKEGQSPDGGQREVNVSIRIGVKPYCNVATRAVQSVCESDGLSVIVESAPYAAATRDETEEKETAVTHLWVLQYALTGNQAGLLIGKEEITELEFDESGEAEIDAMLSYSDNCVVYFVANSPTLCDAETIASHSAFKSMAYDYTSPDEFPMVGVYKGQVPAAGIEVELERMTVSISLFLKNEVPSGSIFTLESVQLKSVPEKGSYYDWNKQGGVPDWHYPIVTDDAVANDALFTDYEPVTNAMNATTAWYMPENRRGNATEEITDPKEKTMVVSPTYDPENGTSYSSHFVVKGSYYNGEYATETTITFFPGDADNPLRNFDLVRNTRYAITAVIKKIDDDDPRIVRESPLAKITYRAPLVIGGDAPIIGGTGVAGAKIVVYFPVDGVYYESNPVTVPESGTTTGIWGISEADAPSQYLDPSSSKGTTYKVVQTLTGCQSSKKALYSITTTSSPGAPNIQFLRTED